MDGCRLLFKISLLQDEDDCGICEPQLDMTRPEIRLTVCDADSEDRSLISNTGLLLESMQDALQY